MKPTIKLKWKRQRDPHGGMIDAHVCGPITIKHAERKWRAVFGPLTIEGRTPDVVKRKIERMVAGWIDA